MGIRRRSCPRARPPWCNSKRAPALRTVEREGLVYKKTRSMHANNLRQSRRLRSVAGCEHTDGAGGGAFGDIVGTEVERGNPPLSVVGGVGTKIVGRPLEDIGLIGIDSTECSADRVFARPPAITGAAARPSSDGCEGDGTRTGSGSGSGSSSRVAAAASAASFSACSLSSAAAALLSPSAAIFASFSIAPEWAGSFSRQVTNKRTA
jgi:hypothetical protein